MQFLNHKGNIYSEDDFTQRIIKSNFKGSYASAMFSFTSMNSDNSQGSHLVCIASYRKPIILNGFVESFDYFHFHIGYYLDISVFLNLKFEEYDDIQFNLIPVTVENGTANEIIEDIKEVYPGNFVENSNPFPKY